MQTGKPVNVFMKQLYVLINYKFIRILTAPKKPQIEAVCNLVFLAIRENEVQNVVSLLKPSNSKQ